MEQDVTNLRQMLTELEAQRGRAQAELLRLDAAIDALRNVNHLGRLVPMRRRKPVRTLSIAARSKIAAAQRARWAKLRTQQKRAT